MPPSPRRRRNKPPNWEVERKRFQFDIIGIGAAIFLLIGAPLLVASRFAMEIDGWMRARGVMTTSIGPPGRTYLILGAVFSIIGLLIVLVGLPQRSKS